MSNQIINLVIIAFSTYGVLIFSYQLWFRAFGLFYKNSKRKLLALKLYKEVLKQNDFPVMFDNDDFSIMVIRKESKNETPFY